VPKEVVEKELNALDRYAWIPDQKLAYRMVRTIHDDGKKPGEKTTVTWTDTDGGYVEKVGSL